MYEDIKILTEKRCIIGESPIWNEKEQALYFTNGGGKEYCKFYPKDGCIETVSLPMDCAAFAFDKDYNMIVSTFDGVCRVRNNDKAEYIYNTQKYEIKYANDMKTGPDGRIYVGTQSEKRICISDKINGKLYSVDKSGKVKVLLEGLMLSNGMDWSVDEKYFYHTDSDTNVIKEYTFDRERGEISFTGRQIEILGVDGLTIGLDNKIYAACWGQGHIAVIDIKSMTVEGYIKLPCDIPASCAFLGESMDILAVTTASFNQDILKDKNAGCTILIKADTKGRKPYLFGG